MFEVRKRSRAMWKSERVLPLFHCRKLGNKKILSEETERILIERKAA